MQNTDYTICVTCKEARSLGRVLESIHCPSCKGLGYVRTRESFTCNLCGRNLCALSEHDTNPYGLIDATVVGGYNSTALADRATYKFSLCERCLRSIFHGFKIPPEVSDEDGLGDYKVESQRFDKNIDAERVRKEVELQLIKEELCTDHLPDQELLDSMPHNFCGKPSTIIARIGENKAPRCEKHGNDLYVNRHAVLVQKGPWITFEDRCHIGKRFIERFIDEPYVQYPHDEHEKKIFISTLFSLIADPARFDKAEREIVQLTEAPVVVRGAWEGPRIATAFPPAESRKAAIANSWLKWGREEGYVNAVANPLVGRSAVELWQVGS
jgi:hypothetical protein